ncbi:MAG: hypothetical protein RL338_1377 [Chloroflexota bacterium]
MRFQDAAPDARAIVYAGIQADPLVARTAELLADATTGERVMARAVMNGERTDPATWRAIFPTIFGDGSAGSDPAARDRAEALLAASLAVAEKGEAVRSQFRGAIVEHVTELLVRRRGGGTVRRERRILFDGVRAEIHPYDVTLEGEGSGEAYDCKWGARGIGADVLDQLDTARRNAAAEGVRLTAALVVFDARRSCLVRLARQTTTRDGIGLVSLETLDRLAGARGGG